MFALSQFAGLNKLAAGVLASSAIIAGIVGFAARHTLANLIAGVMLMIAQPLRIGDRVTILDQSGEVEDVQLNYTGATVYGCPPCSSRAAGEPRSRRLVGPTGGGKGPLHSVDAW